MHNYLLTIVTVTKNCVCSIERTLNSIRAVKGQNVEYIIIDGASTDGTICLITKHTDIVDCFVSEEDAGIYNAMNKGVGLARGRYVLFINGDDELVSDGFPLVMASLAQASEEIVCATTLVGELLSPKEILAAQPWRLPFSNSIPHPSSFVARDLLLHNPFREDLRIVSDYDFFLGAYLSGKSFRILPVITALHQRGGASSDRVLSQKELDQVRFERLGWRYHIFNGLAGLYKFFKIQLCND